MSLAAPLSLGSAARALRVVVAPLGLCLLAACASDDAATNRGGGTGTSSSGMPAYAGGDGGAEGGGARGGGGGESSAPDGRSVTLSSEALSGLDRFVNRRATLFADVIEIDMTRSPFLAGMSLSINPESVERIDGKDEARGLLSIVLRARGEQAPSLTTMPMVRFGDGLEFIAKEQLTLRFWKVEDESRPIHFRARGEGREGNAVFAYGDDLANPFKGRAVLLRGEVRGTAGNYTFEQSAEASP